MTAAAGNVLGVANGGKVATGVSPAGTKLLAMVESGVTTVGSTPPPGVPGRGFPGGIVPFTNHNRH